MNIIIFAYYINYYSSSIIFHNSNGLIGPENLYVDPYIICVALIVFYLCKKMYFAIMATYQPRVRGCQASIHWIMDPDGRIYKK